MKKNILIISIYYPPKQSIASNRIYSFPKYLNKDKYNIFVHTLDEGVTYKNDLDNVTISRAKNNSLLKPLSFPRKTNKIIHYAKVIYNQILLRVQKNAYQKWIDNSFTVLKKKIEKENIELLISSFAPDASHILALKLKKEFPHLKWIADMRDEMSQSPYISKKRRKYYLALEQQIFQYANALTTVSKPILDEFKNLNQNRELLFREIRNGYDFEIEKSCVKNDIFTIRYIGNFYGDRNPNNFLKAVEGLIKQNSIEKIKIEFIGVKTHFHIPQLVEKFLSVTPSVSHSKAITLMKNSDVLLLIHPSNGRKGIFTGKLFEYLGTLKPILALIDEQDVAAKLIQKTNAGYVCDDKNIETIESHILTLFNEYKSASERNIDVEIIKMHHRKAQAKRLESLIEEVLNAK